MARVALSEMILAGTVPASFASGRSVMVCERGTETATTLHDAEEDGAIVAQPLTTDRVGRMLTDAGDDVWVEPGSYDLRIAPERNGEDAQVLHWEASRGDAVGGAPIEESLESSGMGVVIGGDKSTARPTGYKSITWIQAEEPENAEESDLWIEA